MNNWKYLVIILSIALVLLVLATYVGDWRATEGKATIDDFYNNDARFVSLPTALIVPDTNPYYALMATPLAIHYTTDNTQTVIPLLIQNTTTPSTAIDATLANIGITTPTIIHDTHTLTETSLALAETYWEHTTSALLIEPTQNSYTLAVNALPLASYLSMPVIITPALTNQVTTTLDALGVTHTLVIGDNLTGYKDTLTLTTTSDILNTTINTVTEKFGHIDYITLANPQDAWPPQVLAQETVNIGPTELFTRGYTFLPFGLLRYGGISIGTFTIPQDYKYALVKFEGINLADENVDELGDSASFYVGPNLPDIPSDLATSEIVHAVGTGRSSSVRDSTGGLITDRYYTEAVVYDRGGVEYTVKAAGSWLTQTRGEVQANIVIEKLSSPLYSMMPGLSSLAPYLTAYRQGIIYGDPNFAFVADDDVLVNGETCPGYYMPFKNPLLVESSNKHFFDSIHIPLNQLLAKIADIPSTDIPRLQNHYANNPINIALVGDATVLPQYIYDNYLMPTTVEDANYGNGGPGTPSDFLYGNIDPQPYDWSNTANDTCSDYPFQENSVGRITGWDTQDVSALITRTIFYEKIINALGAWKDNAALLIGGGQDFQKPLLRYLIFGDLLQLTPRGEPMKYWTGYGEIAGERTKEEIFETLGFTVQEAYEEEAMKQGFSTEALSKLKKGNLLTRLLMRRLLLKQVASENQVTGGNIMETSNFIWANAHGWNDIFTMEGNNLISSGSTYLSSLFWKTVSPFMGGWMGPGMSFTEHMAYIPREVETMNLGPSFMWLESCVCGKIDGLYPQTTISQALLHAGLNALIAASTESNIAGGYLEPKNRMYDTPFSVQRAYQNTTYFAQDGVYPEPHFGYRIYTDLCTDLVENDSSIGLALRNARNAYLPTDADWMLWWSPPLAYSGNFWQDYQMAQKWGEIGQEINAKGKTRMLKNKYISFQEYVLFGDPAFNPYVPLE